MIIKNEQLDFCLGRVACVVDHYTLWHIGSDDPQRYVDYLMDTCQQYLGVKIAIKEVALSSEQTHVKGAFVATPDGEYDICVANDLNPCWLRFVTCKELFHVVMDCEDIDLRNMDLCSHVEEYTVHFPKVNGPAPEKSVQSEFLAEIAAMEFLFPHWRRVTELNNAKDGDYLPIAQKFMVPRVHVEKYMSEKYMEILGPFSPKA